MTNTNRNGNGKTFPLYIALGGLSELFRKEPTPYGLTVGIDAFGEISESAPAGRHLMLFKLPSTDIRALVRKFAHYSQYGRAYEQLKHNTTDTDEGFGQAATPGAAAFREWMCSGKGTDGIGMIINRVIELTKNDRPDRIMVDLGGSLMGATFRGAYRQFGQILCSELREVGFKVVETHYLAGYSTYRDAELGIAQERMPGNMVYGLLEELHRVMAESVDENNPVRPFLFEVVDTGTNHGRAAYFKSLVSTLRSPEAQDALRDGFPNRVKNPLGNFMIVNTTCWEQSNFNVAGAAAYHYDAAVKQAASALMGNNSSVDVDILVQAMLQATKQSNHKLLLERAREGTPLDATNSREGFWNLVVAGYDVKASPVRISIKVKGDDTSLADLLKIDGLYGMQAKQERAAILNAILSALRDMRDASNRDIPVMRQGLATDDQTLEIERLKVFPAPKRQGMSLSKVIVKPEPEVRTSVAERLEKELLPARAQLEANIASAIARLPKLEDYIRQIEQIMQELARSVTIVTADLADIRKQADAIFAPVNEVLPLLIDIAEIQEMERRRDRMTKLLNTTVRKIGLSMLANIMGSAETLRGVVEKMATLGPVNYGQWGQGADFEGMRPFVLIGTPPLQDGLREQLVATAKVAGYDFVIVENPYIWDIGPRVLRMEIWQVKRMRQIFPQYYLYLTRQALTNKEMQDLCRVPEVEILIPEAFYDLFKEEEIPWAQLQETVPCDGPETPIDPLW
jgi:hypothetical protein